MDELTPADYELSKSRLGPLYRILRAADGELLDGFHRRDASPDWPEEVLKQITTPRQKVAVKIATNAMRRQAPEEEIASYVQSLAQEIMAEGVDPKDVVREIRLDTGLKEHAIRRLLKKTRGDTPSQPSALMPITAPRGREEEQEDLTTPPEMPETPKMPERDSIRYQENVEKTIGLLMGLPVPEIWGRLRSVHEMSLEEAQGYVHRFKTVYQDIWSRHYDSRDAPMPREGGELADEEREDFEEPGYSHTEQVSMAPPSPAPAGIQYSANELLATALRYYPDEIINQVWDTIGLDSRKIPFIKTLFYHCFEYTVSKVGLAELLSKVANEII